MVCFLELFLRVDTVLSFIYGMCVQRIGLFDHGSGLRLLELGYCPYRYCSKFHVRYVLPVMGSGRSFPLYWVVGWAL